MTGETKHHRHCQVNYRNGKSRNSLWRLKRQKQTVNDRRPYLSLKNQLFGEQHGFLTVGFCYLHPTWHVSRPSGALNTCIHKESEIRLFYVTSIRSPFSECAHQCINKWKYWFRWFICATFKHISITHVAFFMSYNVPINQNIFYIKTVINTYSKLSIIILMLMKHSQALFKHNGKKKLIKTCLIIF